MTPILFEIKNSIAFITLNRAEKFNPFNREMAMSLQQCLDEANADEDLRCVCITGAGKSFCAGQDISEIAEGQGIEKILAEYYNPIVSKIRQMDKPVLAAVNGIAAGAGANIALCCDIIIAKESASFIQSFCKIGLIPDSGGTFFLPRLIGFQKASALMMLGDTVTATEAEKIGMIYKIFPDDIFENEFIKMANKLAAMPTEALALTKQALNNSFANNFQQQLKLEDELQQKAGMTFDFKEGIKAFMEKRLPGFTGK